MRLSDEHEEFAWTDPQNYLARVVAALPVLPEGTCDSLLIRSSMTSRPISNSARAKATEMDETAGGGGQPGNSGPRPGFGIRHPLVEVALSRANRLATHDFTWPSGDTVRRTAMTTRGQIPDEVVQAARCFVATVAGLVVCTNVNGDTHAWPGGQRERNETIQETAVREVHEETGWHVEPDSVKQIGWLHFEHLTPVAPDHPWPNPDSFSAVVVGSAIRRDASDWVDTQGYELQSRVVPIRDLPGAVTDELCVPFLPLVKKHLRQA